MNRDQFWLTDAQFTKSEPHPPTDTRGKARVDDRADVLQAERLSARRHSLRSKRHKLPRCRLHRCRHQLLVMSLPSRPQRTLLARDRQDHVRRPIGEVPRRGKCTRGTPMGPAHRRNGAGARCVLTVDAHDIRRALWRIVATWCLTTTNQGRAWTNLFAPRETPVPISRRVR